MLKPAEEGLVFKNPNSDGALFQTLTLKTKNPLNFICDRKKISSENSSDLSSHSSFFDSKRNSIKNKKFKYEEKKAKDFNLKNFIKE